MTPAEHAFKVGFAPQLSPAALAALLAGIERDDSRLIQKSTTAPQPLAFNAGKWVEAADAIVFGVWQGNFGGDMTVGIADEVWSAVCYEAERTLGYSCAQAVFLSWWDDTPRAVALGTLAGWIREYQSEQPKPEDSTDAQRNRSPQAEAHDPFAG